MVQLRCSRMRFFQRLMKEPPQTFYRLLPPEDRGHCVSRSVRNPVRPLWHRRSWKPKQNWNWPLSVLIAFPQAAWQPGPADRFYHSQATSPWWFCRCQGNIRSDASLSSITADGPDVCVLQSQKMVFSLCNPLKPKQTPVFPVFLQWILRMLPKGVWRLI